MTILQLKYVVALSSSESMRAASRKLLVSQPALSTTISDLEKEIGITLFERSNRGIRISAEGNQFLEAAKKAVNEYEVIEQKYLQGK